MIGKLLLSVWILRWIGLFGEPAVAQVWPTSLDESLDERNDAEIFRAVVESMRQWALHKKSHHRTKREVSRVCYEDVGCFEDTGPFSYLEMLPSPPKDVGTRFLVYGSRKARSIPMEVPAEDINDSAHRAIDPDLPTKVIVHGFGSSCDHVWVYEMRSALMTVHECNIVCVDWGPGSAVPNYVRAAANTRLVGRQLAKLIRSLEVPLEKVHLIGFSLGAHVAGFAGAELGNVSRITGLDPAGPLFESQDPRARLDQTDANFVDVIHSNGEQLILGGLGSWQPMGDVDFYPNGGRMQTGCSNLFLGAVSDIIWSSSVEGRSLCNHRRAYKLFTDSVSPKCRFPAFPCDHGYDGLLKGDCFPCSINNIERPCGDMGYYSDESPARGQLYLVTREEEPFCAHQYQARVYNSRGERPTRSYGKLQVTVIGEGGFNESFAMTRKDEELLVGVVLQKIVVPHPAINNIEAIEIKYTAYSGWISSGLVSWSIDKVAIVNSFGNVLSICKKGLILESGLPVHLPLYPGECNVPLEADNSTNPMVPFERLTQENQGGSIGPFTKEQNYENNESHSAETFQGSRLVSQRKSLGPFTKEQNLRVIEENDTFKSPDDYKNSENRRGSTNPWTIVDISSDGDSNSLELQESEKGRSFSGSNFIQREPPTADSSVEATTQFLPEIQEPVLQLNKKEAGRSLKLPEITEPILRPRSARQNARQDACQDKRQDEIQETSSSSSRGFTVQFLPERLAGILAQAERYARQTLLPLISQYTPSFVGGSRNEEPKYFPLWGDTSREESANESVQLVSMTTPNVRVLGADSSERAPNATTSRGKSLAHDKGTFDNGEINVPTEAVDGIASDGRSNVAISKDHPIIIYPEKQQVKQSAIVNDSDRRDFLSSHDNRDRWTPMNEHTTTVGNIPFQRGSNVSRSLDWLEESLDNSTQKVDLARPGTNDWIPITESDDRTTPTALQGLKEDVTVQTEAPAKDDATRQDSARSTTVESVVDGIDESKIRSKDERKFIPLMDFKDPSGFLASTKANDVAESRADVITFSTHIQRIPGPTARTTETKDRKAVARTMIFPYAYERRKDPRTRYIPLIPEEDIGRTRSSFEKDR